MRYLFIFALLCQSLICQAVSSHRVSRPFVNTAETIGVYPLHTDIIPVAPPNYSNGIFRNSTARSGEPARSTINLIGTTEFLTNGRNFAWFDFRYDAVSNATHNDICSVDLTGELVVKYEYLTNMNVVVSVKMYPDIFHTVFNDCFRLDCSYTVDIGNDGTVDIWYNNGYNITILSREFRVAVGPNNPLEIAVSIIARDYTSVRTMAARALSTLRVQVFDGCAPLNPIDAPQGQEVSMGMDRLVGYIPNYAVNLTLHPDCDYDRFYVLYGYPLASPVPFPLNPNCRIFLSPAGAKRMTDRDTFPSLPDLPGDVMIQGVVRDRDTGVWYTTQVYQYNAPVL